MKASEFNAFQKATEKVSRKLQDRVRVKVTKSGNRQSLEKLICELGGNLNFALERFQLFEEISLLDLAKHGHEGKEALEKYYSLPNRSAEKISQADFEFFMKIEELDLPPSTQIELNTAPDNKPAVWRELNKLSTGQKVTALLLLLLLESETLLIVDQPEDDLDNRFITEDVIPIIRQEKQRRQIIFFDSYCQYPSSW